MAKAKSNSLAEANRQKIEKRMASIIDLKNAKLKYMMCDTLSKAMEHALSLHTDTHVNHVNYGNTYGYMLVHDGIVEELCVNVGQEGHGKADRQLLQVASLLPDTGWHGVVLATMNEYNNLHEAKKSHSQYYVVSFETDVLLKTVNFTSTEFENHFRQLKVSI